MTIFDSFPHLGFIFQILVVVSIGIVLTQIKLADEVDRLRHGANGDRWMFIMRKWSMFLKLLALIWTVVYSYERNWQPWPPIIMFIAAFDFYVLAEIAVLRTDIVRIKQFQSLGMRRNSQMNL